MVRIHPDPPLFLRWLQLTGEDPGAIRLRDLHDWGISSAGRAPALQAGGRRFDPVILHQSSMRSVLLKVKAECFALAIEPVSNVARHGALYRLSFFNNQEEVVKRFTKGHLEMGV